MTHEANTNDQITKYNATLLYLCYRITYIMADVQNWENSDMYSVSSSLTNFFAPFPSVIRENLKNCKI